MAEVESAAGPAIDEEDLEDGEIESDGEEETAQAAAKVETTPQPTIVAKTVPSKPSVEKSVAPSPPKKSRGAVKIDDQEDFATSLERQLAQALGKPTPSSPVHQSDENKRSSKEERQRDRDKARKRRRRNGSPDRDRERDKGRKKKSKSGDAGETSEKGAPEEDLDDYEMMNVRGGSPPPHGAPVSSTLQPPSDGNESDRSYSSYDSYDSGDYHRDRRSRKRNRGASRRDRSRRGGAGEKESSEKREGGRGREGNTSRSHRDGNNGNDSERERDRHDYKNHPRKMELCKFYLMECCAKREKCLYMHQDFPCKYYYTGSECTIKDCKFAHGKPLTDALRAILMKHLETAPKEILGDFPRLGRELANQKIRSRHKELCAKFNVPDEQHGPPSHHSNGGGSSNNNNNNISSTNTNSDNPGNIPPLNDIYSKPPPPLRGKMGAADEGRGRGGQNFDKNRKSRWCETRGERPMTGANAIPVGNLGKGAGPPTLTSASEKTKSAMSLKNLTNVLTADQIEKLAAIGIETLDQVKHLTVLQLTEIGLSIGQLSEIQMNAMQVEKSASSSASSIEGNKSDEATVSVEPKVDSVNLENIITLPGGVPTTVTTNSQEMIRPAVIVGDTDMRIIPTVNQDVDMRFLGPLSSVLTSTASLIPAAQHQLNELHRPKMTEIASPDAAEDRMEPNAVIDYSQYLREANLVVGDKSEETKQAKEKEDGRMSIPSDQQRLLTNVEGRTEEAEVDEDDDDDDDETKLKICNVDEEEDRETGDDKEEENQGDGNKSEGEGTDDIMIPSVSYWPMNLASLSTLNKIDLSSSVTQMMSQEKSEPQTQQQSQSVSKPEGFVSLYSGGGLAEKSPSEEANRDSEDSDAKPKTSLDPRDPRNRDPRNSREPPKSPPPVRQPQVVVRPSIYDWNEDDHSPGGNSPAERPDQDMRLGPFYGDANENSDVDLRLPFKPMLQNYVPATEIDGSISSHLPMVYKVFEWDVPKPNFKDIRRRMSIDNSQDPRLKRIFGVEGEGMDGEDKSGAENSDKPVAPQVDPRTAAMASDPRRRKETAAMQKSASAGVDIQIVLQKSAWYTDLGSKNKIFVNQQLAALTSELKRFHEEMTIGGSRVFDVRNVYEQFPMLANILQQLGVMVDEHGAIQPLGLGLGGGPGVGGVPLGMQMPPNNSMTDAAAGMLMPELAAMIQQQQNMPPNAGLFNNMNPAMLPPGHPGIMQQQQQRAMQMQQQQMGNPGGMRPSLLGMPPPNMGFPQGPPPFDGPAGGNGPVGSDMGNFMMNYNNNDNMGGGGGNMGPQQMGGGGFFQQQQQQQSGNRMMMNQNNNNRGNFRNNRDRWVHNNSRGGNDARRHNRRD